jgi:aldehyde:ferredoxin oxidoreductase
MEALLHEIVADKGLGSLLRLGVRDAASRLGKEALAHAAHVKGLELTAYHPSAIMGTALGYAVSSRGGDYNNVYASLEYSWTPQEAQEAFGTRQAVDIKSIKAKGFLIKKAVTANIIVDCLGLCKVPVLSLLKSFNLEKEADLVNGLTGLNLSKEDLAETGRKIAGLERLFNIRHSREPFKDTLPDMFISSRAGSSLTAEAFNIMLQEYYHAMGWDENGIPPYPV